KGHFFISVRLVHRPFCLGLKTRPDGTIGGRSYNRLVKAIKLLRHAARAKDTDALSPEGRVQAEDAGRTLPQDYAFVFVSPARRAAETVAWLLRGSGRRLPSHAIIPGLASEAEDRWRAAAKAAGSSRIA